MKRLRRNTSDYLHYKENKHGDEIMIGRLKGGRSLIQIGIRFMDGNISWSGICLSKRATAEMAKLLMDHIKGPK